MTRLGERLDSLGLSQYLKTFLSEGFDTWETLLDITESDLDYLNVKLGHRRKLQRAIADARGLASDRALPGHGRKASLDASYRSDDSAAENADNRKPTAPVAGSTGTKRKYRRHPKPDENAPERPASAYVIFSNQIREELKGQVLSFTEIAKIVGERWQVLASSARDLFERQAQSAKEKYYAELADYKKTPQYVQYQEYLTDFKAKHSATRTEGKRTKLEPHTSMSTRSSSHENTEKQDSGSRSTHIFPNGYGFGAGSSESSSLITNGSPGSAHPGFALASASTSPAGYASHQSPIIGSTYSPKSTSPASTSGYLAYDLPHYVRSGGAPDPRFREPAYPVARTHGSPLAPFVPPLDTDSIDRAPLSATSPRRGFSRPSPSLPPLPPLIHQDTTLSSDSGSTSAVTPYQGSLLPVLDAPKGERMLPQPIQSIGLVTSPSPLDARPPLSRSRAQGHLEALLRATELARDADEKEQRDRSQ